MNPKPFTYAHFLQAIHSLRDSMLMPYIELAIGIYCNITRKKVGSRPESIKDWSTEYADAFEAANYAIFIVSQKIGSYDPDKGNFKYYLSTALANALNDILEANGNGYSERPSDLEMEPDSSKSDMEERMRRHVDDAYEAMIEFIDRLPEIKRAALFASAFGQILRPDLENYGRNYANILAERYNTSASYIRKLASEGKDAAIAEANRQGFNDRSWAGVTMGLLQVVQPNNNIDDKVLKAIPKLDAYEQFKFLRHLAGSIDDGNNTTRATGFWSGMLARSRGEILRREAMLKKVISENTSLIREEILQIEMHLSALHDYPMWHNSISPHSFYRALADDWIGDQVLLSDEKKTYLHLYKDNHLLPEREEDWDKAMVEELGQIRLLGEYKDGVITLYVRNVKELAQETNAPGLYGVDGLFPFISVMRYVYLHELMHAYFARRENEGCEYNREQEEAFAEFGALYLFQGLVNSKLDKDGLNHASESELEWAVHHVEGKKGVLECYSRGAVLFKQFGHDIELAKSMLDAYPKTVV